MSEQIFTENNRTLLHTKDTPYKYLSIQVPSLCSVYCQSPFKFR